MNEGSIGGTETVDIVLVADDDGSGEYCQSAAVLQKQQQACCRGSSPFYIVTRALIAGGTMQAEQLPTELAQIWARQLKPLSWEERITLMNEFHENLKEMIPDFEEFCEVFPAIVMETLNRIDEADISCDAQAHIYANSADEEHRQRAGAWFRTHSQSH